MRLLAGILLLFIVSAPVSAQDGSKMIVGEGTASCGSWTQTRQEKSFKQGLSMQWVAGFLSGRNMESSVNALAGTDFNGLMAWIDNYCAAHPISAVAVAADTLMAELRSRAH